MCFSEPVSFAAGGVLMVGGAFAGWKAFKINKRYFPVSQMPTLAGLQQLTEGHVWMGVNGSDPSMTWWAAMGFIFFSWLIWPDKKTADDAWAKMQDDPAMANMDMPFDGKRMMWGGFETVFDEKK